MKPFRKPLHGAISTLVVYFAGWMGVILAVNLLLVAIYAGVSDPARPPLAQMDLSYLPAWALPLIMGLQFAGMVALVPLTHAVVGRVAPTVRTRVPWVSTLAAGSAPAWVWAPALVIGLTMGFLPGWIAQQLTDWAAKRLPEIDWGAIGAINDLLTQGSVGVRVLMAFLIAGVAPLAEEFVFRGYFWSALRRRFSARRTWVITSLVFAAYHMDPIQGSALLFSAFSLGFVRWKSGSIWPCVCVHMLNNALGVLAAYGDDGAPASFGAALASACLTLLACVWIARRAQRDQVVDV